MYPFNFVHFLMHYFAHNLLRPEGDSCLNVELCRAALQARLESLKSDSDPDDAGVRELCDRLQAQIEQVRTLFYSELFIYFCIMHII